MFKDKSKIRGKVTIKVFGPDGKIKRRPKNWLQKLFTPYWNNPTL